MESEGSFTPEEEERAFLNWANSLDILNIPFDSFSQLGDGCLISYILNDLDNEFFSLSPISTVAGTSEADQNMNKVIELLTQYFLMHEHWAVDFGDLEKLDSSSQLRLVLRWVITCIAVCRNYDKKVKYIMQINMLDNFTKTLFQSILTSALTITTNEDSIHSIQDTSAFLNVETNFIDKEDFQEDDWSSIDSDYEPSLLEFSTQCGDELLQLRQRVQQLESTVSGQKEEEEVLKRQKLVLEDEVTKLEKEVAPLRSKVSALESELNEKKSEAANMARVTYEIVQNDDSYWEREYHSLLNKFHTNQEELEDIRQKKRKEIDQLNYDIDLLGKERDVYKRGAETADKYKRKLDELADVSQERDRLKNECNNLTERVHACELSLERANDSLSRLKASYADLAEYRGLADALRIEKDMLSKDIADLEMENKRLSTELSHLRHISQEDSAANGSSVASASSSLATLEGTPLSFASESSASNGKLMEYISENSRLRVALNQAETDFKKELEESNEIKNMEYNSLQAQYSKCLKEHRVLTGQHSKLEEQFHLKELDLENIRSTLDKSIASNSVLTETIDNYSKEVETLRSQLTEASAQAETLKRSFYEQTNEIENMKKKRERYETDALSIQAEREVMGSFIFQQGNYYYEREIERLLQKSAAGGLLRTIQHQDD